ncbi:MAG TPA: rod shape-determining protein MreD [Alphaproteobacteria bacterium]|jgi:rod shape-determining protein MreD|nr:rod shape-determining protein MreD [Alphaproteobacteria bacterium]
MVAAPRTTPFHRLEQNLRKLLPLMISIVFAIVVVLPVGLPQWGILAPPLLLISIFYWSLVRPDLMPPTAAFLLGLFQDLLTGAPLGLGALVMVLVQWIMRGQRRYLANRPFFLMWASFGPVVFSAAVIDWLLYALFTLHALPILGALTRMVLGFVLFPVVAWVVLIPAHRTLPPES